MKKKILVFMSLILVSFGVILTCLSVFFPAYLPDSGFVPVFMGMGGFASIVMFLTSPKLSKFGEIATIIAGIVIIIYACTL